MKIGILQTGRVPPQLRSKYGDYDTIYQQMLAGRGFEFDVYAVLDGILPDSVNAAEGWIITGSKFGVYEDHDWIAPLENFLRQTFEASVPIIGVCFGHQILAQALGGTVEKFSGGWSVGAVDYELETDAGTNTDMQTIIAWHQDQITRLPEGARVIGISDFCQYAMLAYGDQALSIQPHPEFTPEYTADLINMRRDILPRNVAEEALAGLGAQLTSSTIADQFAAFFKKTRGN